MNAALTIMAQAAPNDEIVRATFIPPQVAQLTVIPEGEGYNSSPRKFHAKQRLGGRCSRSL